MADDLDRAVGRLEGKMSTLLKVQGETNQTLTSIDERLRKVELKSARNGAVAGGIVSVGVAIAIEKLKNMTGIGGA